MSQIWPIGPKMNGPDIEDSVPVYHKCTNADMLMLKSALFKSSVAVIPMFK